MDPKYAAIISEYERLQTDLATPARFAREARRAVTRDQAKLKETSQRFRQLEPAVGLIGELEQNARQLAAARDSVEHETDDELLTLANQEVAELTERAARLAKEIETVLKPRDPLAGKNIIMEIRAGTGGDEAALFAADLFRMYSRYAECRGWRTQLLSASKIGIGGFKEIIFEIKGTDVYQHLQYESGVHRVQRIPQTEKQGRVHTSTATVVVLPEAEEVDLAIKPEDLRVDVFRSGGHGGQSVNTTDSAVRLTHLPTNTVVTCQDEKSQHQNRAKALQILRSRLLAAEQEKRRRERSDARKSQIGSGDRAEKIRTYNFPQDRITDHRIKQSWHNIAGVIDGAIEPMISALAEADQ